MHVIHALNVEYALFKGLRLLQAHGVKRDSRNGPVLVMEEPVTTVYNDPTQRVVFDPIRDANPFFHLVEALWMLGGRADVAIPAYFVKRMKDFSDDGGTFNAAYGYRWRKHFGRDQLLLIVRRLFGQPNDRRCILQIWDQAADLDVKSKDVACNTVAHFQRNVSGELDMTVFCRSNDIIWGAYGANAVHFSILQEYMAAWIGCDIGRYWHISDNYHAYVNIFEDLTRGSDVVQIPPHAQWYDEFKMHPLPLVNTTMNVWSKDHRFFLMELDALIGGDDERFDSIPVYNDPFFRTVAHPMVAAYAAHKQGRRADALLNAGRILSQDWCLACTRWLERRYDKRGGRGKGKKNLTDGGEKTRDP